MVEVFDHGVEAYDVVTVILSVGHKCPASESVGHHHPGAERPEGEGVGQSSAQVRFLAVLRKQDTVVVGVCISQVAVHGVPHRASGGRIDSGPSAEPPGVLAGSHHPYGTEEAGVHILVELAYDVSVERSVEFGGPLEIRVVDVPGGDGEFEASVLNGAYIARHGAFSDD